MDLKTSENMIDAAAASIAPQTEILALQPLAVVDHLCSVTEDQLHTVIQQEGIGGSRRISQQQVHDILADLGEFHSKAGGSNANTIRGEAANHNSTKTFEKALIAAHHTTT